MSSELMGRELVIFTESFPFFPGEYFLETELPFLLRQFSKVIIVPRFDDSGIPPRPLPDNVICLEPILGRNDAKWKTNVRGLLNRSTLKPFWQGIMDERPWRSYKHFKRWFCAGLLIRNYLSNTQIKSLLFSSKKRILYFYWGVNAAWITAFLERQNRMVAVARFHGGDLYEEREDNLGGLPFKGKMLRRLNAVLPISQHGHDYITNRYPFSRPKIKLCRLGVSDAGLSASSTDGVLRLLSCSNLFSVKRVELTIEALRYTEERIEWVHIGEGPLRGKLEEMSQGLPMNVNCSFLGRLSNKDVRAYYRDHPIDLFLNTSSSEGVPVSIMEALSAGVPVFATAVGGTPELVDDTVGHLLSPDFAPSELAELISDFKALDDNEKKKLRESARRRWQVRADAARLYEGFAVFLSSSAPCP